MFFERLRQKICELFLGPGFISEEEALAEELDRLDRENPGWDHAVRLAAARRLLESGMSREIVACGYGEDMVREIEKEKKI